MTKFFGLLFVGCIFGLLSIQKGNEELKSFDGLASDELSLEESIIALGGAPSKHHLAQADPQKVLLGEQLILKGRAKKGIFKSKLISPYFVCTDCHNLGREFADASEQSPEKRLAFARANNLPFLPASTFWGIYNRKTFYNDDYVKKYGDLITEAKNSLPESIQVCAKYCSAGRFLKDWEVEAILHYFKQHELRLKDLNLSENQKKQIQNATSLNSKEKSDLLAVLNASYVQGFSAHFDGTLPREQRKYGKEGNAENGKFIYDNACLFCHKDGRVTYLKLDHDKLSAKMFMNHMEGYDDKSIYQIVRWGTHTMPGRNQYMPRFTKDKMSDQQIEDLMAYLRQLAEK